MNILVIDDESLILQNVMSQLSEMRLDDRIDTAQSAAEARALMEKKEYQIFLCDIVMPEEDGISLAKWTLARYPDCKFIFLTAHADFAYMKEAISIKSFDYILQPAEKEELKSALMKAKLQINVEKKQKEILETGAFFYDREALILEQSALAYLSEQSNDDSYLKRYLELQNIEALPDRKYWYFAVQVLQQESRWTEKDRPLLRSVYYNILEEVFAPLSCRCVLFVGSIGKGSFVGLLTAEPGEPELQHDTVREKLEILHNLFSKLCRIDAAIYFASPAFLNELSEVGKYVKEEIGNNVRGDTRVFSVGQLSTLARHDDSFEAQEATWKSLLSKNRLSEFEKSVFRYLDFCISRNEVNRSFMMKLHQVVSEQLLAYMVANDVYSNQVFDEEYSYYDFMYCWTQVDSMKKAVSHVVEKLYENLEMPGNDVVQSAIRYIRQNISDDILVTEIAEWVGLNPGYLTRLFKKKTGISLKKYIDSEKMDTAKNLLLSTDMPVTVISGHVGYMNYSNFSRSFKLIVGCTPSEFRQRNGGKDEGANE